jgi:hypothetical protein
MSRPLPAAPARRLAGLALALALLPGCFTIRYELRGVPERGAPREQWHHGLVGGVIEVSDAVKLAEVCPDGVAQVQSQISAGNWFGQLLTSFGGLWFIRAPLWAPETVQVTCAQPAGAVRAVKVVVLGLTPLGTTPPATTTVFTEALAGELRRRKGVTVMSDADVAALLGVEKRKQMMTGCTDAGCLAEIGGALGADRVIHGSVGRVGSSLLVNLSALDARRSRPLAGVSERLQGAGDEAFLDALPRLVDRLLAEPAPAAPARPAK